MSDRQKLKPVPKGTIRCAIYTRKSTEEGLEQEFNSLDAQRESAEAYIRSQQHEGWTILPDRYDDGGFTGGNIERPALQQLLADIEAGKVNCVVVYKVDRLSRSLLDFAGMMGIFDRHQVAFVSVTQAFNTSTSMGRLVLNVLLSFAQFEREISGERIRDKIAATRRKGKWAGGHPLLGYDVKTSPLRIEVNPTEAEQVRAIFALYLEHGRLLPVVEEVTRRGWKTKVWITRKGNDRGGQVYTKSRIHGLLTNVIYAGRQRYKKEVHPGEHEGIVAAEIWESVQDRLDKNRTCDSNRTRSNSLLAGLLRCQPCDRAMAPSCTTKGVKRYRYYTCTTAMQRGWAKCKSKSVPAGEIERYVLDQLSLTTIASPQEQANQIRQRVRRIDYDGSCGRLAIVLNDAEES